MSSAPTPPVGSDTLAGRSAGALSRAQSAHASGRPFPFPPGSWGAGERAAEVRVVIVRMGWQDSLCSRRSQR